MALHAVLRHPDDDRVGGGEVGRPLGEALRLERAARGVVLRVEVEHELASREVGRRIVLAVVARQAELRQPRARFDRHRRPSVVRRAADAYTARRKGSAMRLDDFDYALPPELVALRPARPRPASRLLVAGPRSLHDSTVARLGDWLAPGDLLVFNDTRVIPARLRGVRRRATGAGSAIEATLIAPAGDGLWRALARPGKRLAVGDRIAFGDALGAEVRERDGAEVLLAFDRAGAALERAIDSDRRDAAAALHRRPPPRRRPGPRRLSDGLRRPPRRGRRADRGAALRRGAPRRPRRPRHRPGAADAARRRRHLPAGQGRGHRDAPDARRVGRDRRGGRRGDQRRRRPGDPGRHHGAAPDRDRRDRPGPRRALVGRDRHLHPPGLRLPRRATG